MADEPTGRNHVERRVRGGKLLDLVNYSLPHPLLLLGVWPFYLVFVVFTWVLYSLFFRDRRPEHDGSAVRVGANIGTDAE